MGIVFKKLITKQPSYFENKGFFYFNKKTEKSFLGFEFIVLF